MASRGRRRLGEKWNKWRSLLQRLTHSVSVIFGHDARTHEDKYLSPPILGRALRSLQCLICLEANSPQTGTHKQTLTHTQKRPDWSLFPNADLGLPTCLSRNQYPQFVEPGGDSSAGGPYFITQKCAFYTLKLFIYVVLQTASSFICYSAKLWVGLRWETVSLGFGWNLLQDLLLIWSQMLLEDRLFDLWSLTGQDKEHAAVHERVANLLLP